MRLSRTFSRVDTSNVLGCNDPVRGNRRWQELVTGQGHERSWMVSCSPSKQQGQVGVALRVQSHPQEVECDPYLGEGEQKPHVAHSSLLLSSQLRFCAAQCSPTKEHCWGSLLWMKLEKRWGPTTVSPGDPSFSRPCAKEVLSSPCTLCLLKRLEWPVNCYWWAPGSEVLEVIRASEHAHVTAVCSGCDWWCVWRRHMHQSELVTNGKWNCLYMHLA